MLSAAAALALLGVAGFSFSLPATRLAVDGLDPWFVAFGRAVAAGLCSVALLVAVRAPRPSAAQWRSLALVALGVVVGFPIFTSLALTEQTSAHGAVVIGVLPVATALWAVARGRERHGPWFWAAALAGMAAVIAFAATAGADGIVLSDAYLLGAVALGGLGYAEGGRLSRDLGGARTICWALVLALPVTVPVAAAGAAAGGLAASADAWLGFAYVALVSMWLAFFAWYAGLARGGVARIGQLQLIQPLLTLGWAALLLGEPVSATTVAVALVVLACVVATQRAR